MARDLSKYVLGRFESDIGRLKSDVGTVKSDLDEFRMRMADIGIRLDDAGNQAMSAGAGFDDTDARMSGSAVDGDERAFEVFGVEFDDSGAEKEQIDKWTVYVPSGCVQIDGVAVKFDNEVSEDRVSVSPDVKGGVTLHCVVWKDKDGTAHAKICVGNGERDTLVGNIGSNEGTLYASVPFCTLSDTYEDNNQIHLGAIALTSRGPCRVDSIDDATYTVPTGMEDTGQVITVNYTKAGDDCVDGTNSFTIPILRSSGGGGGDFSMDVTDEDVTGTTDHPNGGVKVTLSPSAGQGTNFTVWNGKDGENGKDAVVNVTQAANGATDVHKNGGTKVTLTPNNGGAAATFDVWNGNDGPAGSDGRSIVSASSGDPRQDGDYTVTPVTFVDDVGNNIGPVDVKAKNGSAGISGVQIEFNRDGNKKLEYSTDGGQSWILIAETVALSSVV